MRFEKWQALGNDYVIVEERELPFELTPARVRALCAPHTGVGSDGVLLIRESDDPGFVAEIRIYNPDGSEAELSGNGAREAIMYLRRRGWTDSDTFSIETAAGEIRPTITSETTCTVDMGRAKLASDGTLTSGDREFAYQHITIGNPQTAIEVEDLDLQGRRALVRPFEGDWYTQPKKETDLGIERLLDRREWLGVPLFIVLQAAPLAALATENPWVSTSGTPVPPTVTPARCSSNGGFRCAKAFLALSVSSRPK